MVHRLFFFKQKTAYEMRISDWSSDVCSSDLVEPVAVSTTATRPPVARSAASTSAPRARSISGTGQSMATASRSGTSSAPYPEDSRRSADRKSVVEGKRGSVRVDVGGRRIIKKKKEIE